MLLNVMLLKQQRQISVIFSLPKTIPLLLKPPILTLLFYPGFLLSVKICPLSGMCFSTLSQCSWLDFTKKRLSWGNHFWLDWQQREVLTGSGLQKRSSLLCNVRLQFREQDIQYKFRWVAMCVQLKGSRPCVPRTCKSWPWNTGFSFQCWETAQMGELWRMSNRSCEGINEGRLWVLNMHFLVKEWQRGIY